MSRINRIACGIVQGGKRHSLLQVPQDFVGDPLMLVEQRARMHHPVANRVDRRHARPAHRILQQRHRILFGCILGLRCSVTSSRPSASRKVNPRAGPPKPLISPENRTRGQNNRSPELALWAASKMENLMDDEPLLITSMCTPPPGRSRRLLPSYTRLCMPQMNSTGIAQ